ncbi:hypothetical protein FDR95_12500 [Rhizobiaceae bacterium LC148]|nr:hypothetical protein FDR95_12500 [Rhizobiaceae bacterium LC148]
MAQEARPNNRKEGEGRDSTKPGTIVAGPDAHERERVGKAPTNHRDGLKKDGLAEGNPKIVRDRS